MLTPAKIQKKATIQIVTFFYFLKKEILFLVTVTITAHELINTSGCIDQLRLTSVERVRSVRDLDLYQRISYAVDLDRLFSVNSRTPARIRLKYRNP